MLPLLLKKSYGHDVHFDPIWKVELELQEHQCTTWDLCVEDCKQPVSQHFCPICDPSHLHVWQLLSMAKPALSHGNGLPMSMLAPYVVALFATGRVPISPAQTVSPMMESSAPVDEVGQEMRSIARMGWTLVVRSRLLVVMFLVALKNLSRRRHTCVKLHEPTKPLLPFTKVSNINKHLRVAALGLPPPQR